MEPGVEVPAALPGGLPDDMLGPSEAVLVKTFWDYYVTINHYVLFCFRKFLEFLNRKVVQRKYPEAKVKTAIKCDRSEPTLAFDLGKL